MLLDPNDPNYADYYQAAIDASYPIYEGWRSPIAFIYQVSYYLVTPAYTVYGWFAPFMPTLDWFPGMYSATLLQKIQAVAGNNPILASESVTRLFMGWVDFLTLIAAGIFWFIDKSIDKSYETIKNLVWNLIIEMSFSKKKQQVYQSKLEERAADLMKLKVEYRNLSKEASQLATSVVTDELTGLYNKRFFLQKIDEEFKKAKESKAIFSIVMMDIDHFKKLNDTYGHLMGDKVLKDVAGVVKDATPKDCFACRFGGEEFAVIMPSKGHDQAMGIVTPAHVAIPELKYTEDPNLVVTISMGMVNINFASPAAQDMVNYEDALKLSDDELYRAKLNGRNRIEANQVQ